MDQNEPANDTPQSALPPESETKEISSLGIIQILEANGATPETIQRVKEAEAIYTEKIKSATNTFLDGAQKAMDNFPHKKLALFLLEFVGVGGYGVADVMTAMSGIRDIAEGRSLTSEEQSRAYLRGGLKVIGALTPFVPTFWVEPVLKRVMPISELDQKQK